ncbi:MAG: methylmalonyl-CoA mutase family protein, partial [Anaerolineales bacterium]
MFDQEKLDALRQSLDEWTKKTLNQTLTRLPERREQFLTTSSEPVNRLYTPLDIADMDYLRDMSMPGEYPYTRGVHPTLYRGRPWTMR